MIQIYVEIGKVRTFANALDWPGWNRSGRDEDSAQKALLEYAPRFESLLQAAKIDFIPPTSMGDFQILERLAGDSTTDFGAPSAICERDRLPVDEAASRRYKILMQAYWQAFDRAVAAAAGLPLRKGPRGGGRDLNKIIQHVIGADAGYLAKLGQKLKFSEGEDIHDARARSRALTLGALDAGVRGELPERGPRRGANWPLHYAIRRMAWHVLDHTWEIEDRLLTS